MENLKVKKEAAGYYRIETADQSFQAEKNDDNGTWNLHLIERFTAQQGGGEGLKYQDTFSSLKEIKNYLEN